LSVKSLRWFILLFLCLFCCPLCCSFVMCCLIAVCIRADSVLGHWLLSSARK
jgi:hypothetical protein